MFTFITFDISNKEIKLKPTKKMENLATTKTKNYAFELLKNERNWLREVLRDKENDSNSLASDIKELEDKIGSLSVAMNKIA